MPFGIQSRSHPRECEVPSKLLNHIHIATAKFSLLALSPWAKFTSWTPVILRLWWASLQCSLWRPTSTCLNINHLFPLSSILNLFLFLCLLYESKSRSTLIKYKHLQSIAKCWIGYQVLVLIRDSLVVGNRNFLGCNKRALLLQLKETRGKCNKLQGRAVTIPLSLPSWPSP